MNFFKVCALVSLFSVAVQASAEQFNALLFTKTTGWHHKSINAGVTAIEKLGKQHFFNVDWQEDANYFNDEYLAKTDVVIFLSTTGNVLNKNQKQALQKFIQSGKGFVGIHSASDTEHQWPWFGRLVGHNFIIHPEIQTAKITPLNKLFPGMESFVENQLWTDEWYEFGQANTKGLNYLITVDEKSYSTKADWGHVKGDGMGEFHPIAWYHEFDGGRSFYTSFRHMPATYQNPQFLNHLYGGIYWAATGKGIK